MIEFETQLEKAKQGDSEALAWLLERSRKVLKRRAWRALSTQLRARADESDIVQNALLQIYRDLPNFRGVNERQWFAWIGQILSGQTAKMVRKHRAGKRDARKDRRRLAEHAVGPTINDERDPAREERRAEVAAAIDELPETMREVVRRRIYEGEPFADVAKRIRKSSGATRVIWTRAIKALRKKLDSSDAA